MHRRRAVDSRGLDIETAMHLVLRSPVVAIDETADLPAWHGLSRVPLRHVAALYRAAGAEVINLPIDQPSIAESTMHTPGPWRCVPTEGDSTYMHQIEVTEGHIASIAGWSHYGEVCPITEANARLIEHAPDLAEALADLLIWNERMGGWNTSCWQRARAVLEHATGSPEPRSGERSVSPWELLNGATFAEQAWNDDTKLALLLDFLDGEIFHNTALGQRFEQHMRAAAADID